MPSKPSKSTKSTLATTQFQVTKRSSRTPKPSARRVRFEQEAQAIVDNKARADKQCKRRAWECDKRQKEKEEEARRKELATRRKEQEEAARRQREEEDAREQDDAAQLERELAESRQILEEDDMDNQERKRLRDLENERRVLSIDFDVHIFCKIYLDKKRVHVGRFGSYRSSTIDKAGEDVEIFIDTELDEKAHPNSFDYESHLIVVKSDASKATRKFQTIDDFSTEQWAKVEKICAEEYLKWRRVLELTVEVKAKTLISKWRRDDCPSSDPFDDSPASPAYKREYRTRSTQLRDQQEAWADAFERMGQFERCIMDRW